MNGEGTVLSSSSFFPSHFLRSVFPFLQSWQIVEINRVRLLNFYFLPLWFFQDSFFLFARRESRLVVKFLETILCLPSRYLSPIRGTGRFGEVRGAPLASAGNVRGISSVLGHCTPRQRDSFPCHESPCPAIKGCTRRAPANNFYFTSKK